MAASYHTRSNSFPTRSHPLTSDVGENLRRLRYSQAASTSLSSSIAHELNGLQDLHDSVDKMLQLPLVQQALAQGQHKKWVDDLLNGSLRILETSSIAQNALLQIKESTQGLQSVLRRRGGDEIELATEEHVSALKEVEAVTLAAFGSLLSFISGAGIPSKLSGFVLASKLIRPKRIACEEVKIETNEFEKVDAALTLKSVNTVYLQNQLKELESSIQDLEEGL
ncbi:hypothetical protein WN944_028416 [Citrus x changshan-huyou]|uniref:Uncharacterized protein n=2 Tax=Citrus TaxID=2706 RepID=A0ACB8IBU0_CITSI|nr:hypothetical protein KPL71_022422 [Citrus sinensis]